MLLVHYRHCTKPLNYLNRSYVQLSHILSTNYTLPRLRTKFAERAFLYARLLVKTLLGDQRAMADPLVPKTVHCSP